MTKGVPVEGVQGAGLLASPVRRLVMDSLANHRTAVTEGSMTSAAMSGMTAAQLAELLGLHVSTVRFHLDQLVAAGLVRTRFTKIFGVGRPRKLYEVEPGSLDVDREQAGLRVLAELLAEHFTTESSPAEAGAAWSRRHVPAHESGPATTPGGWLSKIAEMIDVMQEWGYTPELSTSEGGRTCRIDLVQCPFIDMARTNPAVVCGVHRGLIAGAMEQLGETDVEVSLEPFVEKELCQAHLRTRQPFSSPRHSSPQEN